MKQRIGLQVGQQTVLTNQIQQAIKLLQMSTIELSAKITEELEQNPLLELDEADFEDQEPIEERIEELDVELYPDEREEVLDVDSELESSGGASQELEIVDGDLSDAIEPELLWTGPEDTFSLNPDLIGSVDRRDAIDMLSQSQSLVEHLEEQLFLTNWTEREKAIGRAIFDGLDDDGYFVISPEEVEEAVSLQGHDAADSEVEEIRQRVHAFSPDGVAAMDLKECLLIQLQALPEDVDMREATITVVEQHFEFLVRGKVDAIRTEMDLNLDELNEIQTLIRSLNPRPASQFAQITSAYIVPDLSVRKDKDGWFVEMNSTDLPRVRVNGYYSTMLDEELSSRDRRYLRRNLEKAKLLISSLAYRNSTLLRTAQAIVERQIDFLEQGEEAMKPLVLADIAMDVGVHDSTISRLTTRKYIQTPRGIFELKYFFSSKLGTNRGSELSSIAVKAMVKRFINEENPIKPISDSRITKLLRDRNIDIARRTVAKYREALSIPASSERKQIQP